MKPHPLEWLGMTDDHSKAARFMTEHELVADVGSIPE